MPEPGDPSSSFPRPGSGQAGQGLDDEDRALLEKVEAGFQTVGELYNACKFRPAPSVPFPRLHSGQAVQAWAKSELPAGQALRQPAPLFRKLDESVVEEEYARLEG